MKHLRSFLTILAIVIMTTAAIAGSHPATTPGSTPSETPLVWLDPIHGQEAFEHGDHGFGIINAADSLEHRDPPPGAPIAPDDEDLFDRIVLKIARLFIRIR